MMSTRHDDEDTVAGPGGALALQTIAMPKDANYLGDIFGGWLLSQMDLAGAVLARRVARGRIATVAVDSMVFLRPVPVGAVVSCYARLISVGRSSMQVMVEVWVGDNPGEQQKVTEGKFTFVAIDEHGRTRAVNP
jgi:acyl-CoA thioesterase YciA